mgnify:CR=1 FL=1
MVIVTGLMLSFITHFSSHNVQHYFFLILTWLPLIFVYLVVLRFLFFVLIVNFHLENLRVLVEDFYCGVFSTMELGDDMRYKSWRVLPKVDLKQRVQALGKIFKMIKRMADCVNESMGILILLVLLSSVTNIMRFGYRGMMALAGKENNGKIEGEEEDLKIKIRSGN